jgi:hypothetical protein
VVAVISIDAFCRGLGVDPHPLPAPEPGETTRHRPVGTVSDEAWVPMLPAAASSGPEADLFPSARVPNVARAMSLVPDCVRMLKQLSAAHYLPMEQVIDPKARRTLDRAQMELLAGRVSALNECFY